MENKYLVSLIGVLVFLAVALSSNLAALNKSDTSNYLSSPHKSV